jgi:hypothetical protein
MGLAESGQRAAPASALLLLCLIWAADSLRADLLPGSGSGIRLSTLAHGAVLLGLLAVLVSLAALIRKAQWPCGKTLAVVALVGFGLFVVPALLIEWSRGWIDDSTRVALFSITPVFAVVLEPYLGNASAPGERGGLAAALAAVMGTLLVFPVAVPHSVAAGLAICGVLASASVVAVANCAGVRVCQQTSGTTLTFTAVAAGCAALCLGALGAVFQASAVPFDEWAAPDLVALALLFWLMGRMSAVRMTTRFVIAPLLANLIGLAFLRPHVQVQAWIGLALVALGSGWLLLAPRDSPDVSGSPLGLR